MYFGKMYGNDYKKHYYDDDEVVNRLIKYYKGLLSKLDDEDDTDDADGYEAIAKVPIRVTVKAEPQYNKKNKKKFTPLYFPKIKNVLFREPATIVFFEDGSKTTAVCGFDDKYDKEVGLAICMLKRVLGNQKYREIMDKWCYDKEKLN